MFRSLPKLLVVLFLIGVFLSVRLFYGMKMQSGGDRIEIELDDSKNVQKFKTLNVAIPYKPVSTRKMTPPVDDEDYDGDFWFE